MNNPVGFNIQELLQRLNYLPRSSPLSKKPVGTFLVKGNMRDDRTSSQLEADRFSGIRSNEIWLRIEIWILGRLAGTVSFQQFFERPECLTELYATIFGIEPIFDKTTQHHIDLLKERKSQLSDPEVQDALNRLADKKPGTPTA